MGARSFETTFPAQGADLFDHPLALELAYIAVEESIRLGASYADARYELRQSEDVLTRNGRLVHANTGLERGLGIRVLVKGSWGYVGVSEPNRHDVTVAARRAVETARAAAILQDRPVEISRQSPQRGLYRTKIRRDPLAVPLEDKLELMLGLDAALREVAGVVLAETHIRGLRQRKMYVSSEGSELDQELVTTGAGYRAGATDGHDLHFRSFPTGTEGLVLGQGWEAVSSLPLLERAPEIAAEAVALSKADVCEPSTTQVILTGAQLAHHVMGTTAHLFELDRVLGLGHGASEASFLSIDQLGSLEFGAPHLNIYADARETSGAGTFGFDDEGVAAQRVELVTRGRFTGLLCGRETAERVGLEGSAGCLRASDWANPPSVRPTNVSVAPGEAGTLDDIIADTEQGLLVDGPRAFSVDPFGRSFTATAEAAWEIKDGKRGRILKNPRYQGSTTAFWKSCDALGDARDWTMHGCFALPKGRARQQVPVGAGAPPARFKDVVVGAQQDRPELVSEAGPVTVLDSPAEDRTPVRKTKSRRAKKKSKRRVRKKDTK